MRGHLLKGAEREATVTADLLRRGFEVFQAVGNFSCDLLVQKYGCILRVEVKGPRHGRLRRNALPNGPVARFSKGSSKGSDCTLFDVRATQMDEGSIVYQRSILHIPNKASQELDLREEYSDRATKRSIRRAQKIEEEHGYQDGAPKQNQR